MNKNGIEFYDNVFNDPDLLINEINKYEWTKPLNVNHEDRSNSIIYFIDKQKYINIFNIIDEGLNKFLNSYKNLYFLSDLTYSSIEALKYEPNEKYVMHYDNGPTTSNRVVSCVIYLNDDYKGGEIEFVNFGIKQKPIKNSMVLFPSNYPYMHTAHKVLSGTRYAINLFLEYK